MHILKTLFQELSSRNYYQIKSALFGVAVGDALGVPVEFYPRERLIQNPVTGMREFGTHGMPKGTWSDDSSLTFCLAEALTQDFDMNTIGKNFVKWYKEGFWTPFGEVFDIGFTTRDAIERIIAGHPARTAGNTDFKSNGNGSLMRILPLVFYLKNKPIEERFQIIQQVSSITHGHIISVIACFYYLEFALQILSGIEKFKIYHNLQTQIPEFLKSFDIRKPEEFHRLLNGNIYKENSENIYSSGYVIHTLEASIWCFLNTNNYREAVLKAVNLGEDTDTTAAVTGGIAGLLYGFKNIQKCWISDINGYKEIDDLARRMASKIK